MKVKLDAAWLTSCCGDGREATVTCSVTVTVTVAPGAILPKEIPVVGSTPGCATPLTSTLFGTNTAPEGIASVTVTFATRLPVLVTFRK
ncbi:hypothetical protein D3C73_1502910 [compost metagenome]